MSGANDMSFCVVGAGPSGVVAARYLKDRGYAVRVFDPQGRVGGTFVNKRYDAVYADPEGKGMRLVSSKTLTAFSDYRMHGVRGGVDWTRGVKDHPRVTEYLDYLDAYADAHGLRGLIEFRTRVVSIVNTGREGPSADPPTKRYRVVIERTPAEADGTADAAISTQETLYFDGIAVCSGLHNIPSIPSDASIPGLSAFRRNPNNIIMHSSAYKDKSVFAGRKVLILGCGETAMDLAHRACVGGAAKVGLVSRHGFLSIPHELADDRPLDVFITNFLEHTHEHPLTHDLQLRWRMSTWVIRAGLLLVGGSSWGMNQWACRVREVKRGYHIINKSHGAIPHINAFAKRRWLAKYKAAWNLPMYLWTRFWIWAHTSLATDEKDVTPIETFGDGRGNGLQRIVPSGGAGGFAAELVDEDGELKQFDGVDMIVFATGYRQEFPFLSKRPGSGVDAAGRGFRHAQDEAALPGRHFIIDDDDPYMGFIGFVRPNVGAIPPISEVQVMWWLAQMDARGAKTVSRTPSPPPTYMLNGAKYQYGVDYGNYMYRLAEEIDAAPNLVAVAREILFPTDDDANTLPLWERAKHAARFFFTCCLGQAHVPLFRLRGPFASPACRNITLTELWEAATTKRGVPENIALSIMTVYFVAVNAVCYICDQIPFVGQRRGFVTYA